MLPSEILAYAIECARTKQDPAHRAEEAQPIEAEKVEQEWEVIQTDKPALEGLRNYAGQVGRCINPRAHRLTWLEAPDSDGLIGRGSCNFCGLEYGLLSSGEPVIRRRQ